MRYHEIDFIKGIAVILMFIFHIFYLCKYMGIKSYDPSSPLLHTMARFAHTTFIICMGINLTLCRQKNDKNKKSNKHYYKSILNRCMLYLVLSFFISYFSYLAFGKELFVKFGIIHFMTLGVFITSIFADKPKTSMITSIIIIGINLLLELNKISFHNLNKYIGFITGLNVQFGSLDYFPLIPWIGVSLFGSIIGNTLYSNYNRNYKELEKISNKIENNPILKLISLFGKNSLLVYLYHFPLLYLILYFYK
tara:strand:- start:521 stop:1273 length:753 start_codon:yes stop_codon:yes gene_type:complete